MVCWLLTPIMILTCITSCTVVLFLKASQMDHSDYVVIIVIMLLTRQWNSQHQKCVFSVYHYETSKTQTNRHRSLYFLAILAALSSTEKCFVTFTLSICSKRLLVLQKGEQQYSLTSQARGTTRSMCALSQGGKKIYNTDGFRGEYF